MWVTAHTLSTILGKDMADTLCKYKGGIPFYVPKFVKPCHELAKIVGVSGLTALCAAYQGEYITVPCAGVKKEAVIKALEQGKSKRQVARDCGVSLRYVCMVADNCGIKNETRQLTLFEHLDKCNNE